MRCVAGIAKCVTNSGGGCDANNNDAPSAGYQVLSVTDMGTLKTSTCGLATLSLSYGDHPLFGQCSLSGPGVTQLSVYVDKYCAVQMVPMKDTACAEPAAVYWSTMKLRAYYAAPDKIANVLTGSSGQLLLLAPAGDSTVSLTYWPATTAVANAAAVIAPAPKFCSGTTTVLGGQVAGVSPGSSDCPAGSYDSSTSVDGCRPW